MYVSDRRSQTELCREGEGLSMSSFGKSCNEHFDIEVVMCLKSLLSSGRPCTHLYLSPRILVTSVDLRTRPLPPLSYPCPAESGVGTVVVSHARREDKSTCTVYGLRRSSGSPVSKGDEMWCILGRLVKGLINIPLKSPLHPSQR